MRGVTKGINTVSSGSADVYLPCIVNLHSQREILLVIMAAITAITGPVYHRCLFNKWTGGGRRTRQKQKKKKRIEAFGWEKQIDRNTCLL